MRKLLHTILDWSLYPMTVEIMNGPNRGRKEKIYNKNTVEIRLLGCTKFKIIGYMELGDGSTIPCISEEFKECVYHVDHIHKQARIKYVIGENT